MTFIENADKFITGLEVEAYRVGGSVRDEIIGKKPKDGDYVVRGIALSALAARVQRHGAKPSWITARNNKTIGVRAKVTGAGLLEIVLPRKEVNAGPGREQEIVVDHTLPLEEDALRRDFTFNALYRLIAAEDEGELDPALVFDPTGHGLDDLARRIVRTTHPASFRDDPLRILRALRFVSTLDADLAPETEAQMRYWHKEVHGLTKPAYTKTVQPKMDGRMCKCCTGGEHKIEVKASTSGTMADELKKLLMGQCPAKALRIARDTGVLAVWLPELASMLGFDQGSRYHDLTTDEHTFKALETAAHVDAPLRVRMALLFHDAGKPEAAWTGADGRKHYYANGLETEDHEIVSERLWREAAGRLNVEKKLRNEVSTLILNHMVPVDKRSKGVWVRRQRVALGDEMLHDLLIHRACDISGKGGHLNRDHIWALADLEKLRGEALEAGVPVTVKDLKINGRDAVEVGLEGREIGNALARVLDEVVCQPDEQTMSREWQLKRLGA